MDSKQRDYHKMLQTMCSVMYMRVEKDWFENEADFYSTDAYIFENSSCEKFDLVPNFLKYSIAISYLSSSGNERIWNIWKIQFINFHIRVWDTFLLQRWRLQNFCSLPVSWTICSLNRSDLIADFYVIWCFKNQCITHTSKLSILFK